MAAIRFSISAFAALPPPPVIAAVLTDSKELAVGASCQSRPFDGPEAAVHVAVHALAHTVQPGL